MYLPLLKVLSFTRNGDTKLILSQWSFLSFKITVTVRGRACADAIDETKNIKRQKRLFKINQLSPDSKISATALAPVEWRSPRFFPMAHISKRRGLVCYMESIRLSTI